MLHVSQLIIKDMKAIRLKRVSLLILSIILITQTTYSQTRQVFKTLDVITKKPLKDIRISVFGEEDAFSNAQGIAVIESTRKNYGDGFFVDEISNKKYKFYSYHHKYAGVPNVYNKDTMILYMIDRELMDAEFETYFHVLQTYSYNKYVEFIKSHTDSLPEYPEALKNIYPVLYSGAFKAQNSIRQDVNGLLNNNFIAESRHIPKAMEMIREGRVEDGIIYVYENIDLSRNDKANLDLIDFFLLNYDIVDLTDSIDLGPYYQALIDNDYNLFFNSENYLYSLIYKEDHKEYNRIYENLYNKFGNSFFDYRLKRLSSVHALLVEEDFEKALRLADETLEILNKRASKEEVDYGDRISDIYVLKSMFYENNNDIPKAIEMRRKSIEAYEGYSERATSYKHNLLAHNYIDLTNLYEQINTQDNSSNIEYALGKALDYILLIEKDRRFNMEYILSADNHIVDREDTDLERTKRALDMIREYSKTYPHYLKHTEYKLIIHRSILEFMEDEDYARMLKGIDEAEKVVDELEIILPYVYTSEYIELDRLRRLIAMDMEDEEEYIALSNKIIDLANKNIAFDSTSYAYNISIYAKSLAEVYYHKNDFNTAEDYYIITEDALKILSRHDSDFNHNLGYHYNAMGDAYLQRGEFDKAIEVYNKTFEIEKLIPEDEKVYFSKAVGNAYFFRGDARRAKGDVEGSIEDYNSSEPYFKKAYEVDTSAIVALGEMEIGRGLSYYMLENKEESIEAFKRSIICFEKGVKGFIFNKYVLGLELIIELYKEENDAENYFLYFDKLIDVLEDYFQIDPSYGEKYYEKTNEVAGVYSNINMNAKAYEYYRKSLDKINELESMGASLEPDRLVAQFNVADKAEDISLYDTATHYYKLALQLNQESFQDTAYSLYLSNNKHIYERLGMTYCALGDIEEESYSYIEAKKNLEKAVETMEEMNFATSNQEIYKMSSILHVLGLLNSNLGQYLEAEKSFSRAITLIIPLMKDNKEAVEDDIHKYYSHLGRLYYTKMEDEEKARNEFMNAMLYYEDMSDENKDNYIQEHIYVLNRLIEIETYSELDKRPGVLKDLKAQKKKAEKKLKKVKGKK